MQEFIRKLNLQLFGEGAASGGDGGTGAGTGVGAEGAAADAGQKGSSLEAMGVPRAEIERYRAARKGTIHSGVQPVQNAERVADQQTQEPDPKQDVAPPPKKSLKDALKENSDWNQEMQGMMRDRLTKTNTRLSKAEQILELVGQKYGITPDEANGMDYDALMKAVDGDKSRLRKRADELGVDVDTADRIDRLERENKAAKKAQDEATKKQAFQNHYMDLQKQGAELAKEIPGFNIETAMQDENFFRMTAPGGLSVKQAWYALHGDEIASKRVNDAVATSKQAIANSIKSGRSLPQENGTTQRQTTGFTPLPYSQMNAAQRAAWEREARRGKQFS